MFSLSAETALVLTAFLLLFMTIVGLVFTLVRNRTRRKRAALDLPREDAEQIKQVETRLNKLVGEVRKLLPSRSIPDR